MHWSDLFIIAACIIFVSVVLRSMFSQWRGVDSSVPLKGKYHAAREWLEENGYRIIRIRERAEWVGYYNEREYRKQLVADFIVRQGPRLYVVKVRSGKDERVTAAQLREYWYPFFIAFQVHGVLHIDVEEERANTIDFEVHQPRYVFWRRVRNRLLWMLAGVLIALMFLHQA